MPDTDRVYATVLQYEAICSLFRHNFPIREISELLSLPYDVVREICASKDAN